MKKLAIITTHPIQYYAPLFQMLAANTEVDIRVFYTWGKASMNKHDPGFDKKIIWDIPLLTGYKYEFLENSSKDPGSHTFTGIVNKDIIDKIDDYSPSAILVYGWSYQSHLKVLTHYKNKVPIWFRGDSVIRNSANWIRRIAKNVALKWVYKHVDLAFYVGKDNKKYFLKYGLTEKQLVFAPHAVDNERFSYSRSEELKVLRDSLGLSIDDILILFAGKFDMNKDPLSLIRAFELTNNELIHILIVGNGVLEKDVKEAILLSPYSRRIHLHGFQNQLILPVYYQACDVFCLPSHTETWGLAVNEAMACGKAILVSSAAGCSADLVHEGLNGYSFKAGDVHDLANKLEMLSQNKARLDAFGRTSKKMVDNYTIRHSYHAIINALNHD